MPATTSLPRPTLATYGFEDAGIQANVSTVHVFARDGVATVRMPSRSATMRQIQEAENSIFTDGRVSVNGVTVNLAINDAEENLFTLPSMAVRRVREGRRVNFRVENTGEETSPLDALGVALYEAAMNNQATSYAGSLRVHMGVAGAEPRQPLGLVSSMRRFQRIYDTVENYDFTELRHETISGGFGVPTIDNYGDRAFGIEIEVDFPQSSNYGQERMALARALYEAGLSRVREPQRWHYAARVVNPDGSTGYSTDRNAWTVEFDRSVDTMDGLRGCEIVSPILTDNAQTWLDIKEILDIVTDLGGEVTSRTGLHVNISTNDMRQASVISMLTTATQFDDLLVRIAHTPEIGSYHRGRGYCGMPWVTTDTSLPYLADHLVDNNGHMGAINLSHMTRPVSDRSATSARAEFRYFDGTLQVGRIQTYVMLCMAMVNLAVSGVENLDKPAEPSGSHVSARSANGGSMRARNLSGEEWKQDSERIREFIDHLRINREAAKALVAAYRQSRWMRAVR